MGEYLHGVEREQAEATGEVGDRARRLPAARDGTKPAALARPSALEAARLRQNRRSLELRLPDALVAAAGDLQRVSHIQIVERELARPLRHPV